MGKEIKYEFDYMRINDVMSHVIVYEDGSVEYTDFTDIEPFRAFHKPNITEKDVLSLFDYMTFDKGRRDEKYILKGLDIPFYDVYLIIKETRGIMANSCFWIRFKGDDVNWELLRKRANLPV